MRRFFLKKAEKNPFAGQKKRLFCVCFSEKWRECPTETVKLGDRGMLTSLLSKKQAELRQQCREWFLASAHRLLAYARQQVDDVTDVELLIADVARKVAAAIAAGRVPPEDIAPYTLRSVYNKAAELRKKNARRRDIERRYTEEEAIRAQGSAEETPQQLGDAHLLARRYLRELPEDIAAIITLRIWDELSFAEIARKLRIPETTVRRKYEKGIQQLKSNLNLS